MRELVRAQTGAEVLFQGADNSGGKIAQLRIGEGRFAALERDAHQQRIFSCWHILAAEEISSFDGNNFRNL